MMRAARHLRLIICLVASMLAPALAQAAGDRALGQYLSAECTTCHQISGRVTGNIPQIIAWPEDQFIAVMKSYRDKHRDNAIMQTIAGKLDDTEIAALAAFFGGLALQPRILQPKVK
jgi:cytochrome c553